MTNSPSEKLIARAYQHEMFEASIEGNTIVVVSFQMTVDRIRRADPQSDADRQRQDAGVRSRPSRRPRPNLRARAIMRIKYELDRRTPGYVEQSSRAGVVEADLV